MSTLINGVMQKELSTGSEGLPLTLDAILHGVVIEVLQDMDYAIRIISMSDMDILPVRNGSRI